MHSGARVGLQQTALRMLPAHQRLDAPRLPGRQVDLRLVVDDELSVLDRVAYLRDELEPVRGVLIVLQRVHDRDV